ncbi:hypothetical protein GUJ93_ZPchr0019g2681 [Zizania palustris]|uniref:Uncharacterized protein n=1 Tax=Zizania palustris TaxID=103762 RepID=A0A8J5SW92_ZIZPA|nr:hypothetical protein GUJ93_ZPchr0019g2681 [Zizania palustris]
MATGLCDGAKPRRYDLTMSRRTRRPAAANVVTDCCQDQGMEPESQKCTQLKELFHCPCATDELQSQQPEDTQVHKALQQSATDELQCQQPEDTQEHKALQQSVDAKQSQEQDEARHQQQQWLQSEDNSRRLSLQELIDETINGEKDAATGNQEESSAVAAAILPVQGVTEAAAAKQPEHVAGRRKMIGMMRRYVKIRSIKPKHAPESNVAPIC